jgi:hypothetical protein
LSISRRTVRRDVDRLREMGYNIRATMGPDGGYRLHAGSELPPLLFDDDQAVALAVALQGAALSGVGIEEAAVRALTTVRQVLPSRLRHRVDALQFTAIPASPGNATHDAVSPDVLVALSDSVRAHDVLRFEYATGCPPADTAPAPLRRVEPHHLVTVHRRWYLVAWDLEQADWRIFRADRITPHSPTGPRFAPRPIPGGNVAEYVSARFTGLEPGSTESDSTAPGNSWPCTGKVVLHRPASGVLPFAGDAVVEDLGDDRCSVEAGSWSWIALAAWLGRFDTDIEVIGPPQLADAFAALATRCAASAAPLTGATRPDATSRRTQTDRRERDQVQHPPG